MNECMNEGYFEFFESPKRKVKTLMILRKQRLTFFKWSIQKQITNTFSNLHTFVFTLRRLESGSFRIPNSPANFPFPQNWGKYLQIVDLTENEATWDGRKMKPLKAHEISVSCTVSKGTVQTQDETRNYLNFSDFPFCIWGPGIKENYREQERTGKGSKEFTR